MTGEEDKGPLEGLDTEGFTQEEIATLSTEDAPAEPEAETPAEVPVEAETAPEPQSPAEKAPEGFVPYQSLKEMREANKDLRKQLDEFNQWQRQLNEKLVEHRSAQQEPEEPQVPSTDEDPVAAIEWTKQQLLEMQQQNQQAAEQNAQQQQLNQVIGQAVNEFDAAAAKDPELQQAYEHVRNAKIREMEAWGMEPVQMQDYLRQFMSEAILNSRQRGTPITDTVRGLANAYGFQPQAPKADAAAQIEKTKEAVEASKTLSGGGDAKQDMTIDDLLSLPGDELDALAASNPELFEKLAAQ